MWISKATILNDPEEVLAFQQSFKEIKGPKLLTKQLPAVFFWQLIQRPPLTPLESNHICSSNTHSSASPLQLHAESR